MLTAEYLLRRKNEGGGYYFLKKGFYFIKIDSRTLFLVTFFISLSIISSWMDKLERDYYGAPEGVAIEGVQVSRLLPGELREVVQEMAIRYQKVPVEPSLDRDTGAIIAEQAGVIVDVEKSVSNILAAREGENIELVIA